MNKPSVSLCMIVKNEEDCLARCLNSAMKYVDEIVIVDTGSTDKTMSIAKSHNTKLIQSAWEGNFSKARNLAIDNATCDWILILDADEVLEQVDISKWNKLLSKKEFEGYSFKVLDFLENKKNQSYVSSMSLRLFRNKPEYRYQRMVHEQIEQSILNHSNKKTPCIFSGLQIFHYGYLEEVIKKKNKIERNLTLLKEEVKAIGDPYSYFNLGAEFLRIGDYKKAIASFDVCLQSKKYNSAYMAECHKKKALALYLMGRYQESILFLKDSICKYSGFTDLYFLAAEALCIIGRFKLAISYFKKCLEIGDVTDYKYSSLKGVGSFRALYRLGLIAEEQQNTELALKYYQDSLRINRSFVYVLKSLINLLARTVSREVFVVSLHAYINFFKPIEKYYIAFMACSEIGYYEEGIKVFNKALKAGLNLNGKIITDIALVSLLAKKYEDAMYYLDISQQYQDVNELKRARIKFVLGLLTNNPKLANQMVNSKCSATRNHNNLYRYFYECIFNLNSKIDINLSDENIAECLEIFNILICANSIEILGKLLSVFSGIRSMQPWVRLCKFYINNKKYKLAILELEDCHRYGYVSNETYFLLGLAYSKLGLLQEAIESLEHSLKLKREISTIKLLSEVYKKKSQEIVLEGLMNFPESKDLHNILIGRRP